MNPFAVFVTMCAGAALAAVVAGAAYLCIRIAKVGGELREAMAEAALAQRNVLAKADAFVPVARSVSNSMVNLSSKVDCLVEYLSSLERKLTAVEAISAQRETFVSISSSMRELNEAVRSFVTLLVNSQAPGSSPADLVKGTALDATGMAYPYDEQEMAEHERLRRKARGEPESSGEENQGI